MALLEVKVPDIGDFDEVTVIELMVKVGDTVKADQSLITVESDKASMEIPSSTAGVVKELRVNLGDKVKEGSVVWWWKPLVLVQPLQPPHPQQLLLVPPLLHPLQLQPLLLPQHQAPSKFTCQTLATSKTSPSSKCL